MKTKKFIYNQNYRKEHRIEIAKRMKRWQRKNKDGNIVSIHMSDNNKGASFTHGF